MNFQETLSMIDRLPDLPESKWSEAQRTIVQAIINGPRGKIQGPFVPLMRSPELMDCAQRMGEYLRYRSAIGTRLSELAILVVARHWSQQVEWAIHAPIAANAGIAPTIIEAIAAGQRPEGMSTEEATVYDFSSEILGHKRVSDATWARMVALFGEPGAVDLLGINGYYSLLAMIMNASQTPAPTSDAPPLVELG